MARQVSSSNIPTRRVVINNEHEMPTDYGTTPGGTIFGTTPGGTRIVYERAYLMHLRGSPLARTPPSNLPNIPGITVNKKDDNKQENNQHNNDHKLQTVKESTKEEEDQFDMDM